MSIAGPTRSYTPPTQDKRVGGTQQIPIHQHTYHWKWWNFNLKLFTFATWHVYGKKTCHKYNNPRFQLKRVQEQEDCDPRERPSKLTPSRSFNSNPTVRSLSPLHPKTSPNVPIPAISSLQTPLFSVNPLPFPHSLSLSGLKIMLIINYFLFLFSNWKVM